MKAPLPLRNRYSFVLFLCICLLMNTAWSKSFAMSPPLDPDDVALDAIISPTDPACPGIHPIQITIRNSGTDTLYIVGISWSLNAIQQAPFTWSGNLAPDSTMTITLATFNFFTGLYSINVILYQPNGVLDPSPGDNSKNKIIHVLGALTIVNQPLPCFATTGFMAFFSVTATGNPAYQWQNSTDGGLTWNNLMNSPAYNGVNDSTLWLISPTLSMTNTLYRCILNSCSSTLTSDAVELTVIDPVITWLDTTYACTCYTPPQDILVPVRVTNFDSINSVSLAFFYKNSALQYNGYQNVNPGLQMPMIFHTNLGLTSMIRIASFSTFGYMSIPDSGILVNFKFKVLCDTTKLQWDTWTAGACQYSTGAGSIFVFGSVFKDGYVLDGGPEITQQPVNEIVNDGGTAVFSVQGITHGAPITYQWQLSTNGGITWADVLNNATYNGATTTTLLINSVTVAMNAYKYRCRIDGLCESVFSNSALLTVNQMPFQVLLGNANSCQGAPFTIPVIFIGNDSVNGFNLTVDLGNSITYLGYQNVNPLLNGGNISVSPLGNSIQINWFSVIPAVINGTEMILELVLSSPPFNNYNLTWDVPNCQLNNLVTGIIAASYVNTTVAVNPLPPIHTVVTPWPANGHFCAGGPGVQIGLDLTDVGVNYSLYRNGVLVPGYNGVAGTGFGLTFNTFNIPGTYTVHGIYPSSGCSSTMNQSVTVIADPPPVTFNISGGGSYCIGGNGLPVGLTDSQLGVAYYLYLDGDPIDTLIGTGVLLTFGNQFQAGTYTIIGINSQFVTCPISMNGSAIIGVDTCGNIEGVVSYLNSANTPMNNTQLTLLNNNNSVAQTTTAVDGSYAFQNVPQGFYSIESASTKVWGGANASDALKILKHFVGMEYLTGLFLEAGDIDGSGIINGVDALGTARRFVGQISSFPSGDWAFEDVGLQVSGTNTIIYDYYALCYGDVDGSFVPAAKQSPGVELIQSGEIQYNTQDVVCIPLVLNTASDVYSVSLVLNLDNSEILVKEVTSSNDGILVFRQIQDQLRIAWYSISGIQAGTDKELFTLWIEDLKPQINWLSIGSETLLTDFAGNSITGSTIIYPKVTDSEKELSLGQNTPNPFSLTSQITYYLPKNGRVVVEVFDIVGREVMRLFNDDQLAGDHSFTIDGAKLIEGVYTYRLTFSGSKESKTISRKMIVQH